MKKAKEKGTEVEVQRVKSPTPNQIIDALIGEEEKMQKQERRKKETQSSPQTQLYNTIRLPPIICRDQMVSLLF